MVCPKGHGPSPEGGEPHMKNVSLAPVVTPFARGLALSELRSELGSGFGTMRDGASGVNAAAAWRPATPMQAPTYAAAAAIAALPTVKTSKTSKTVTTAPTATKQHQIMTNAARTNSPIEGSPPWRIPV
jgi:aminoglycoside phosphotransferase (APT) family kinase protein